MYLGQFGFGIYQKVQLERRDPPKSKNKSSFRITSIRPILLSIRRKQRRLIPFTFSNMSPSPSSSSCQYDAQHGAAVRAPLPLRRLRLWLCRRTNLEISP